MRFKALGVPNGFCKDVGTQNRAGLCVGIGGLRV